LGVDQGVEDGHRRAAGEPEDVLDPLPFQALNDLLAPGGNLLSHLQPPSLGPTPDLSSRWQTLASPSSRMGLLAPKHDLIRSQNRGLTRMRSCKVGLRGWKS